MKTQRSTSTDPSPAKAERQAAAPAGRQPAAGQPPARHEEPLAGEGSAGHAPLPALQQAPVPGWSQGHDERAESRRQKQATLSFIIESKTPAPGKQPAPAQAPDKRSPRAVSEARRAAAPLPAESAGKPASTPVTGRAGHTHAGTAATAPVAAPGRSVSPGNARFHHVDRIDQAAREVDARYQDLTGAGSERASGSTLPVRPAGYAPAPLSLPPDLDAAHWAKIGGVIVVSLAVLWLIWGKPAQQIVSRFVIDAGLGDLMNIAVSDAVVPRALDDRVVTGPPSISAQRIDAVLESYGSPAAGSGRVFYDVGVEYGIDPAYALAFFIHESSAGTNPAWAGWKPDGSTTHNVGNIICAGYPTCYGRFRDYPNWETGVRDWYRLIRDEYIQGRGLKTVDEILPIYAPAFENDVGGYVGAVMSLVNEWRQAEGLTLNPAPASSSGGDKPNGNPLGTGRTVMTQGYGVPGGTHFPPEIWGAIDLAIDGDGDGRADPQASLGVPIYATHNGFVTCSPNTHPAGNHIWLENAQYKTGYSHLLSFVDSVCGSEVTAGTQIGTLGSTGMSSGPHLDYQVWVKENGSWVNHDPHQFNPFK